jgi:carbamoyl-phosphate synthase large subunit
VAAKLALGDPLPLVKNSVTQDTTANFEPSLDYVVTKIPRWDLKKFNNAVPTLGSGMKSVGEVMAFGRSFEESFQKAIRMVEPALKGFEVNGREFDDLEESLRIPSEDLIYAIATALENGQTVEEIHDVTDVDFWYLRKLERIFNLGKELEEYSKDTISAELLATCKEAGFSDLQIAERVGCTELELRDVRKGHDIVPVVKQIDTLAAEFPANTNYLYVTYNGTENDVEFSDKAEGNMVLGGGCYRIGSSVEFDYSAVQAIRTLRDMGRKSVMINYNPETVSTDYDESDRLYFEELSLERVLDIFDKEKPEGTLVSVGGQIPNTLCLPLHEAGVPIIGTHPTKVDQAEDRDKFSSLMDEIGVDQPAWKELTNLEEVAEFCDDVGFPVLVRPSYVLSGAAMNVVQNPEDLARYLKEAADVSSEHPVVISKFIENALEIELDAIAENGKVINYAIAEHIEQAGVHSGDATLVLPVQELDKSVVDRIYEAGCKVAKALEITGPFNAQFIVKDDEIKIIETNLRASRSLPFCSKVLGVNFVEKAVRSMLGDAQESNQPDTDKLGYVGVKVPQFSFQRLLGADPVLGVEMASTGEVACFGSNKYEAFLKGMISRGFRMPNKNILIVAGDKKEQFLESARSLESMGFNLFATPKTAEHLRENGIEVSRVPMPRGDDYMADPHDPDVLNLIKSRNVDLVINFPRPSSLGKDPDNKEQRETYVIRRAAIDHNVPFLSNIQVAQMLVESLGKVKHLDLKSYGEYRDGVEA